MRTPSGPEFRKFAQLAPRENPAEVALVACRIRQSARRCQSCARHRWRRRLGIVGVPHAFRPRKRERMPPSKTVALAMMVCAASFGANAETALEVRSWCNPVANAKLGANDVISYPPNHNTGFCWGAFATIQEFSKYRWPDNSMYLGFCPLPTSSRLQYVKVFSKICWRSPRRCSSGIR